MRVNISESLLINFRNSLPILAFSCLLTFVHQAQSASPTAVPPRAQPPATYPQIVRLSYAEGDVRISRGKLADKEHEKEGGQTTGWEQATANIPIESGYNLVTGKGRAEIEFEDASTVYLAENSVLSFSQITATGGVPYTEIALLAGTATINVHTLVEGETFNLTTPTDTISLRYPRKAVWRINSYLDAVSITPLADLSAGQSGITAAQANLIGKTTSYKHGQRVPMPATVDPATFAGWDKWVGERLEERELAMSAAMKDAGLAEPVPGLADMNGKGTFFSCAPYGTCWQPTNGWEEHLAK